MIIAKIIIRALKEAKESEEINEEINRIANQQNELTSWIEEWKAYKDTGLTPEEIVALQTSFQELKKEAVPLMQAKVEEKLVKLPVKIGDTAFFITNKHIFGGKVYFVYWEHHKSFGIRGEISANSVVGVLSASLFDFGKTVFRTRDEAEAALKEQEE